MFKSKPVTAFINHLLTQSPIERQALVAHAGKIILVHLHPYTSFFCWQISQDSLFEAIASCHDGNPHIIFHLKFADLSRMITHHRQWARIVTVEGEADFAYALSQLSQRLEWDIEHDLSQWIGNIAAVRVTHAAKRFIQTAQRTIQSIAENVAEYVSEEYPMLVRPRAIAKFTEEVTYLGNNVEKLMKRAQKL